MGIFRKKEQQEENDIFEQEFALSETKEDNTDNSNQMFDEEIGFETGVLKGNFTNIKHHSETLDVIRKKVVKGSENVIEDNDDTFSEEESTEESPEDISDDTEYQSLLEKCKAFTVDENGNDFSKQNESLYHLKSVAEILKNDQLKSLDLLSKKYDIQVEDESDKDYSQEADESQVAAEQLENEEITDMDSSITETFVDLVNDNMDKELSDDQMFEDYILRNNSDTTIEPAESSIPDISDIDNTQKLNLNIHDHSTAGATLKYIPVKDTDDPDKHISISSTTQNIDLGKKLNIQAPESSNVTGATESTRDDFDDFKVEDEILDHKDITASIKKIAIKKRTSFISSIFSVILTLVLSVFSLNYFQDNISYSSTVLLICMSAYILNCFANIKMYSSLAKSFKKQFNSDFTISLLSLFTITLSVLMLYKFDDSFSHDIFLLLLLSSVILSVRSVCVYFTVSAKLGNLKSISTKSDLYAVDFISDQSIAYSIAKDSVEGDILIAAPHKTQFVNSFNKYTAYSSLLYGRYMPFQIIGLIISIVVGSLGFAKFHSIIGGMYCLVSLLCIFAFPVLFLINSLPCYSAAKKLNKCGAAVFGTAGASKLDSANAVILSTNELFPSGTIVLKDLKILSENSIDDTILKAASLTEAVGSTLTPIFKKIAKTNSTYSLPDSDTVKYEDTLGLSGWVDNELLFVGNRTLMESHGIEVPSIEVDKRILRNGCFPIYVATVQKACALLIVKYNPSFEIAKELRKLSGLGVTLLFTNSDPNINEAMISDYFDVYEDSIKIVSNAGKHMYNNSVISKDPMESPAAFKRHNLAFLKIMNSASAIKKSNALFSIVYIVAAILCAVAFVYLKFASDGFVFNTKILVLAEIVITVFSLIIYLFKKP